MGLFVAVLIYNIVIEIFRKMTYTLKIMHFTQIIVVLCRYCRNPPVARLDGALVAFLYKMSVMRVPRGMCFINKHT
jgi:hypothetical protein